MKKLIAFTLAETLVVIGIIGVVSALTLPNLNNSTGNKEKVAKLQKTYTILSDAFGRVEAVYGPLRKWSSTTYYNFPDRIEEFLKANKRCTATMDTACAFNNTNLKKFDGTTFVNAYDYMENSYAISWLLADGVAIYIGRVTAGRFTDNSLTNSPLAGSPVYLVLVDIDGKKGSSTMGKDVFEFVIVPSGVYPLGTANDKFGKDDSALSSNCFTTGSSCAGWVLQNENMDYLKCPSTLSWSNTTCK